MEVWQGLTPKVREKYQIVRIIKSTPEKEIMLLEDRQDQTRVILRNYPGEPSCVYSFLVGRSLPHIPQILEVSPTSGGYFVLEKAVEGQRLEGSRCSVAEACCILCQLCEALDALHKLGIIHRDVKPSNILQTESGEVYLLDLDAGRIYKNYVDEDTCTLGTAGYAAPEQFGIVQTDHRADLFALGVTLNVLLVGSHPSKQLCTGGMRHIVLKCTQINPKRRYQSAKAVWRAAARVQWLERPIDRRKRWLSVLGMMVLCGFIFTAGAWTLKCSAMDIAPANWCSVTEETPSNPENGPIRQKLLPLEQDTEAVQNPQLMQQEEYQQIKAMTDETARLERQVDHLTILYYESYNSYMELCGNRLQELRSEWQETIEESKKAEAEAKAAQEEAAACGAQNSADQEPCALAQSKADELKKIAETIQHKADELWTQLVELYEAPESKQAENQRDAVKKRLDLLSQQRDETRQKLLEIREKYEIDYSIY